MFSGTTRRRLSRHIDEALLAVIARTCSIFHYAPTIEPTPPGCTSMYFWKLVYSYLRRWMSRAHSRQKRYPYVLHKRISRGRNKNERDRTPNSRALALCSSIRTSLIRRHRLSRDITESGVQMLTINQQNFLLSQHVCFLYYFKSYFEIVFWNSILFQLASFETLLYIYFLIIMYWIKKYLLRHASSINAFQQNAPFIDNMRQS